MMISLLFLLERCVLSESFHQMQRGVVYCTILLTVAATVILSAYRRSYRSTSNKDATVYKSQLQLDYHASIWNPSTQAKNNAIAFLFHDQVQLLAPKIALLDSNLADNQSADIIILHTGYPFRAHLQAVANATRRQVTFLNVDQYFMSFPHGFDPYLEDPTWTKRGKWNYHHMCRFWFKLVVDIPLVTKYEYLMRLDDDSKLTGVWFNIFEFMTQKKVVCFANVEEADTEHGLPGLMRLKSFTYEYIKKYSIIPKNPARLERAFNIPNHIRLYNTNFDVIKVKFFQTSPVRHWVDAVDNTFGIYRYRWGDHVLRYLTTALFATSSEVLLRTDFKLPYCHPC